MHKLEINKSQEITRLHNEIISNLRSSLENAIKIGELLIDQKANLKHGQFTAWIKDNLPFTDRTARNYMRVYSKRDQLKTETVSDLKSAYLLLSTTDIEKTHCFGKYVDKKRYGIPHCIDYCHAQCGNFDRGTNLSKGGVCQHPKAGASGRFPDDWESKCSFSSTWTLTMTRCPRGA